MNPQEKDKLSVELECDGERLKLPVPLACGKIGVYGAIKMAEELASRIFWDLERKQREEQKKSESILSRLHFNTMGKR